MREITKSIWVSDSLTELNEYLSKGYAVVNMCAQNVSVSTTMSGMRDAKTITTRGSILVILKISI